MNSLVSAIGFLGCGQILWVGIGALDTHTQFSFTLFTHRIPISSAVSHTFT